MDWIIGNALRCVHIGFGDEDARVFCLSDFHPYLNIDHGVKNPECSDLPHCDVGVSRSGHHQVIAAVAMQSPHFVLVCIKCLHTLISLNGPELHKAIRTSTGQARTEGKEIRKLFLGMKNKNNVCLY